MRGVDGTAGNDPDKLTRTAANIGGATGNAVGSVQGDENKLHGHSHRVGAGTGAGGYAGGIVSDNGVQKTVAEYTGTPSATDGQMIGGSGAGESRPKNANVNYIIKV